MDCQHVIQDEVAEKYVTGQLDAALQDEFEMHILECARCLQQVEALNGLRSALTEQAHEIRLKSIDRKLSFRWVPVAAAAVVFFVVAISVVQILRRPTPQTAAVQPANTPAARGPVEAKSQPTPEAAVTTDTEPVKPSVPRQERGNTPTASPAQKARFPEPQQAPLVAPPVPVVVAQAPEQKSPVGAAQPKVRREQAGLTQEQGAELFRIGIVDAPAYAFSGFATGGKDSAAGPTAKGYSNSGQQEGGRALFQTAMTAYVEGRYRDAADKLEGAAEAEPNAPDVNFYLGVCRLLQAHPAEAVQPLKKIIANGKSPLVQSAHFYLAKAYVQTNDLAAAEGELQAAAGMPGRMKTQAAALLSRVQALRSQMGK